MSEQFFHFLVGILYFILMLLLEMVLPLWTGDEKMYFLLCDAGEQLK